MNKEQLNHAIKEYRMWVALYRSNKEPRFLKKADDLYNKITLQLNNYRVSLKRLHRTEER